MGTAGPRAFIEQHSLHGLFYFSALVIGLGKVLQGQYRLVDQQAQSIDGPVAPLLGLAEQFGFGGDIDQIHHRHTRL